MTIWILAFLVIGSVALAGWRQGAIRAAFSFVGILLAALLAVPLGKLFHPLLPHLGASNPVLAWALAPLVGFILVSAVFLVAAQVVHRKVEVYYKYQAGDLRQSLFERINTRLGICLGLMNGAIYFVLICFVIFNLAYWTTQVAAAPGQSLLIRTVNQLGNDLQATGLAKAAKAVGTLSPSFYNLADLSGLLIQNPQVGPRLATYPALASFWQRDDVVPLLQDSALTNAVAAQARLDQILNSATVQGFLANKELTKTLLGVVETNLDDLTGYLNTGKSAKYDGEKLLGQWEFNPSVTVAWMRQNQPQMPATELRAVRAWIFQAYAQTRILITADNQIFFRNFPRLKKQSDQQPPTTELNNWKGDWTRNGDSYDLHLTLNGEDKFMTATVEGIRLSVKDGRSLLIFDRAD